MSRLQSSTLALLIVLSGVTEVSAQSSRKPIPIPGWGELMNPNPSCKHKILESGLKLTLPAAVHDLSVEIGRMNAPRVLRPVKGDFTIQVRVAGVSHPGNQSAIPGRRPFCSAGILVWQNERNYIRLERAELLNGNSRSTYASWELRKDGKFARAGRTDELPLSGAETWLRISRTGETFTGAASPDGQQWSSLSPITLGGNDELMAGILAINDTRVPFHPQFSELSLQQTVATSNP